MLEMVSPDHYRLQGRLSMRDGAQAIEKLLALVNHHQNHGTSQVAHRKPLTLDISGLQSADSVLLAVIIGIARAAESQNLAFSVIGFPERLMGLARAYSIDGLITPHLSTGSQDKS